MRRQNQTQSEQSDDDCTSSASQILEKVQPDRVTITKPEEDRRRRTIIVEKKNGSYGFTLQSYGIHYKKEQEIEMITYVDYVDYDGPAYRAGMREGDVILSINGNDMEKADHKTLVNFIKSCESRMRMVVLFEDCVRKVELHIRYIQLQRILQSKMIELEKVCIKERQLLEGKWKTHSLPARKKQQGAAGEPSTPTQSSFPYCRPTLSTEDVAKAQHHHVQITNNQSSFLAYRYLDPHYRYNNMIHQPSGSSISSEYLLTFDDDGKGNNDHGHLIVKTPCDPPPPSNKSKQNNKVNQTNNNNNNSEKQKKSSSSSTTSCHGSLICNPCIQLSNNSSDNTSLEAYDLASPCCNPHCVPSSKRRSNNKHHKEHNNVTKRRDSKCEETQTDNIVVHHHQRPPLMRSSRPHSQASQTSPSSSSHHHQVYSAPRRYFHIGAGLMSQCSLHSCTSSELSAVAPTTVGESSGSYTTSLSTDTLYWNGSCDNSRYSTTTLLNNGGKSKYECQMRYSHPPNDMNDETFYVQYGAVVKPKSWDNLATKAFGGYGFGGYGYIDSSGRSSKTASIRSNSSSSTTTKTQGTQYVRVSTGSASCSSQSMQYNMPNNTQNNKRYFHTNNKSTESLLSLPKYSDSSCECLNVSPNPTDATINDSRFFQSSRVESGVVSPTDPNFGYYSVRSNNKPNPKQISTTSSEATRL